MHAIVIMDGFSLADFRANQTHHDLPSKTGSSEMARLLGSGREFGHGPFMRFLDAIANRARSEPDTLSWLMIFNEAEHEGNNPHEDSARSKALFEHHFAEHVTFIGTTANRVPWQSIVTAIENTPQGLPKPDQDDYATNILLVGFTRRGRILALAQFLRNMLGCPQVAVCPHLFGSMNPDAFYMSLQHVFPSAGIRVILDLQDAGRYVGLAGKELDGLVMPACRVEPAAVRQQLSAEQTEIIQRICVQLTGVELHPLQGGFSGSLLLLAHGRKDAARTEPSVIKIDRAAQMQREIDGYHQVHDYVGRQVPKFGLPVAEGEWIGVSMALAALDGHPWTLQDCFQGSTDHSPRHQGQDTATGTKRFLALLQKSLNLLSTKLYQNTLELGWLAPYRELRLHSEETLIWFDENISHVKAYAEEEQIDLGSLDFSRTRDWIGRVAANDNIIETEVCLVHGDLNFKNIIFDDANNIWFIDWTHTGVHPVEIDFAKMENDLKFVLSKNFDRHDLERLRLFEEFLVSKRIPPEPDSLEGSLQFVKWDLRYRTVLKAVILIRRACFAHKQTERWLCYRITLLKLGLHTLSFDERRGQGECGPIELLYAAISVHCVTVALMADDYQTRITGARPSSYPRRQRIDLDDASWSKPCSDYDPPYHVDDVVLENNHQDNSYGWADPETLDPSWWQIPSFESNDLDELGRPLNPAGRTGIAGRGLLGRWGVNPAVCAVIVRVEGEPAEILVGRRGGPDSLGLARRFLKPGEKTIDGLWRMIQELTTYQAKLDDAMGRFSDYFRQTELYAGQIRDPRQTDHAWVDLAAQLIQLSPGIVYSSFGPTQVLGQVEWRPLVAETINELDPISARLARLAIRQLCREGAISEQYAHTLLIQTGRNEPC